MDVDHEGPPEIGVHVEISRYAGGVSSFERAEVVDRLEDPKLGVVLELLLADNRRMQRVWPSPTIRPLNEAA